MVRIALSILSALFFFAALFHGAAIVDPALGPSASRARHALFVLINLACAAGFARRPRVFFPAFALLVLQQLASHGADAWRAWRDEHAIDMISLGVLVVMPVALALLIADARTRR